MTRLARVAAAVYGRPWYIIPEQLDVIADLVQFHIDGGRLSPEQVQATLEMASVGKGPRRGARTVGAVGIIPVYGAIFPRANLMTEFSGGATISGIRSAFQEAMADESIGSILFDVDSPGGYADGVDELATEIREARGKGKVIVASADYSMASAATYLMSGVDEIVASPSAMVGWVGTVMVHQEFSKMDEAEGITTRIFRNPVRKYEANSLEPLTDAAAAHIQETVDDFTAMFHNAMAKGRGVSLATVKADFGQGTGMSAAKAKAAGLVDRVEPFEATVRRLATGKGPASRGTSAMSLEQILGLPAEQRASEYARGLADGSFSANSIRENEGLMTEGDETPADDPDAPASGEAGTPPDRSKEAAAALALARARADRS